MRGQPTRAASARLPQHAADPANSLPRHAGRDMPARGAAVLNSAGNASRMADATRERVTQATGDDAAALMTVTRREHIPLGILFMVGATIVFAVSSAISKWLVDIYPVGEVLFTRSGISFIACALFILPQTGLAVFHTKRRRDHVMRSLSQSVSQTFLIIAFSL